MGQMDILPSEDIEKYFLKFDEDNDSDLGPSFVETGFSSLNTLVNMGSSFIYLIGSFFLVSLTLFAVQWVSSKSR
jgi:hypothetical protein